jgi:sulfur-carrier protein
LICSIEAQKSDNRIVGLSEPMTTSHHPEITVIIKLFAVYQETFGTDKISLQFPPNTPVRAVLDRLAQANPELVKWREITRFGINLEFVDPDTLMSDRDEIVLIPPVSGG